MVLGGVILAIARAREFSLKKTSVCLYEMRGLGQVTTAIQNAQIKIGVETCRYPGNTMESASLPLAGEFGPYYQTKNIQFAR